ncbi:MAG TPA: hypothetical protein VKA30_00290 [Actinomycetota bacterium]|nr:hypothetical protein [Actinomycetota bacterium]
MNVDVLLGALVVLSAVSMGVLLTSIVMWWLDARREPPPPPSAQELPWDPPPDLSIPDFVPVEWEREVGRRLDQ